MLKTKIMLCSGPLRKLRTVCIRGITMMRKQLYFSYAFVLYLMPVGNGFVSKKTLRHLKMCCTFSVIVTLEQFLAPVSCLL